MEQGHGNVYGDLRTTPSPIILSGNRLENQKRKARRLMIEEGQVHQGMEEVIWHNMDPEGIVPGWLKDLDEGRSRGGKERK